MNSSTPAGQTIRQAAHHLRAAEALLIGAGAGMGVDSGLPDFRGREGFWNTYPPFRQLGLDFTELADPRWFQTDPRLAWGFYGHRMNLYRATQPHGGFQILRRWGERCRAGAWVFTSNVDGHFQRAGFPEERVLECHGSIHRLQNVDESEGRIWSADGTEVVIDEAVMRAVGALPSDPVSGKLARPNICMFNDGGWNASVTENQWSRYQAWVKNPGNVRLVVIELGAGTAIPSVRRECEARVAMSGAHLIRINPREPNVPPGHSSLACSAWVGLKAMEAEMAAG